jgi:uncharacterized protein YecT (DUF1311 family)
MAMSLIKPWAWTMRACVLAIAALVGAAAVAQDEPADEVESIDADADPDALFDADLAFMQECLDTLAARGAPARACMGIVARQCGGSPGAETTAGAIACQSREGDVWSALLDAAVDELSQPMSNAERDAFSDAQDAWRVFRDAQCGYEAALYENGSLAGVERASCESRLTAQRTLDLRTRKQEVEERLGGR